jgi:hypothetical protein
MPSSALQEFKQKSTQLGTNLSAWQEFNPAFTASINSVEDIIPGSGSISFIEAEEKYLELSYSLKTPVFNKTNETTRMIEFKLSKTAIRNFIQSPFFIIPENTIITFVLPPQTTVQKENVMPEAQISSDNEATYISWIGLKKTTNVNFTYAYWKEIAPSISIALILKNFIELQDISKLLLILLILILLVFAFLNKKRIEAKIEDFIEAHTKLEEKE